MHGPKTPVAVRPHQRFHRPDPMGRYAPAQNASVGACRWAQQCDHASALARRLRSADVSFLQEVERMSRQSTSVPRLDPAIAPRSPAAPLPKRLRALLMTARRKGTAVRFMPAGMDRHETNTTSVRASYVERGRACWRGAFLRDAHATPDRRRADRVQSDAPGPGEGLDRRDHTILWRVEFLAHTGVAVTAERSGAPPVCTHRTVRMPNACARSRRAATAVGSTASRTPHRSQTRTRGPSVPLATWGRGRSRSTTACRLCR